MWVLKTFTQRAWSDLSRQARPLSTICMRIKERGCLIKWRNTISQGKLAIMQAEGLSRRLHWRGGVARLGTRGRGRLSLEGLVLGGFSSACSWSAPSPSWIPAPSRTGAVARPPPAGIGLWG